MGHLLMLLLAQVPVDAPVDSEVTGIVIGGISYEDVVIDSSGAARVTLLVESNYGERYRPRGEQRFYARERIHLSRARGAR